MCTPLHVTVDLTLWGAKFSMTPVGVAQYMCKVARKDSLHCIPLETNRVIMLMRICFIAHPKSLPAHNGMPEPK
jgi:hypothetical protein